MTEVSAKFVSQKVNKIRWRPVPKQTFQQSEIFATGSWDNDINKLSVWYLDQVDQETGPELVNELEHSGDVTDLVYMAGDHILTSSSTGNLGLYKYENHSRTLTANHIWEKAHHHGNKGIPCTGIATKGDDTVVSVGEDGRIVVTNLEQDRPVQTIDDADSCTLNAVAFLKQSEIATVNSTGQLRVWDLRSKDQPRNFILSGDSVPLHCVDKHPTQPHIVVTGGQDKTLCIWDMRQDKFPINLFSAHSADIWEVKFHPTHPDHLFTCSDDGTVWHWDRSSASTDISMQPKGLSTSLSVQSAQAQNPWLTSDASKQGLEIVDILPGNVMPCNTMDICGSTLLCGTDGEQLYTVRNLAIR